MTRSSLRPRGRRVLSLVLVSALAMCAACTGDGRSDASRPRPSPSVPPGATASPPPVAAPTYVGQESPLVQRLWRPVDSLPVLRTSLPQRLDTDQINGAPSLHDAPIERAVLAVGINPAPFSVTGVAVMSPRGELRVVDRQRLGMRDPDYVEQQYLLSPDGRTLALGDEYGIVLVDIPTATSQRVTIEANDVVLHWWTPDGSQLVFTPRSSSRRTLVLTPDDGTVHRADYRAWVSSVGPDGKVVELVPRAYAPRHTYTAWQMHQAGNVTVPVVLPVRVQPDPTVGRQWRSLIPVLQTPGRKKAGLAPARGVVALDARSGQAVGLLELDGKSAWASMRGETADGWLLLTVAHGPGGGLVAWDPVAKRLRAVMAFDEQATHVSIALQVFDGTRRA